MIKGISETLIAFMESRKSIIIATAIAIFMLFIIYSYVWDLKGASSSVIIGFIVSVLATLSAVAMGADVIQKKLDIASRRAAVGEAALFWSCGRVPHFKIFTCVHFERNKRVVSFDTMSALSELTSILSKVHGEYLQYDLRDANELITISDLEKLDENIILLGGDRSIPLTTEILKGVNSNYRQDCSAEPRKIIYKPKNSNLDKEYESKEIVNSGEKIFSHEYALVTRIPVNNGRNFWYVISGNHGLGTYLAALAVSDSRKMPKLPTSKQYKIQAMIEAENVIHSRIPDRDIEVICKRGWEILR